MNKLKLESRLQRLADLQDKITNIMDSLPVMIPGGIKQKIINALTNNDELQKLVYGINNSRPPRLILVGRTGVGKSSLINAMFGKYLAEVSDIEVGTRESKKYSYINNGEILLEVIDTRGTGESDFPAEDAAYDNLKEAVKKFAPDVILFLGKAKERGYINRDINKLSQIIDLFSGAVPIIAINTQVDTLEPSRIKEPANYSGRKLKNITNSEKQLRRYLEEQDISPLAILSVSSYLEWGIESEAGQIEPVEEEYLTTKEQEKLELLFDGRYNIDQLLDLLEDNLELRAQIKLMFYTRLEEDAVRVSNKIVNKFIKSFASVAGTIGLTPIPTSDIFILTPLQVALIMIIAYLAGRNLDYQSAKEVLLAIGGNSAAAVIFQQGAKLLNLTFPGLGSGISATIASSGTYGIGKAAQAYFLNGVPRDKLQEIAKQEKKTYERQQK